ncbi:hypothetical protein CMO96_01400 [Candidatus Woesebacteria bacterium]|nr:hypothetical protein [Candidatus Woesebacteria bacterium]
MIAKIKKNRGRVKSIEDKKLDPAEVKAADEEFEARLQKVLDLQREEIVELEAAEPGEVAEGEAQEDEDDVTQENLRPELGAESTYEFDPAGLRRTFGVELGGKSSGVENIDEGGDYEIDLDKPLPKLADKRDRSKPELGSLPVAEVEGGGRYDNVQTLLEDFIKGYNDLGGTAGKTVDVKGLIPNQFKSHDRAKASDFAGEVLKRYNAKYRPNRAPSEHPELTVDQIKDWFEPPSEEEERRSVILPFPKGGRSGGRGGTEEEKK